MKLNRIGLASDFIRIFEVFCVENFSKFRDFVEIDAVSRWILHVSKIWNQFWNLCKKPSWKVMKLSRIELTSDFIRIFEVFCVENFSKFRDFVEIDAVSRWILHVSKIWNQFWNLCKKPSWKVMKLSRIELTSDFIRIFEVFCVENFSKFRDFVEIDAISRWIIHVFEIWNQFWNLREKCNWKMLRLKVIKLTINFIRIFEIFVEKMIRISNFFAYNRLENWRKIWQFYEKKKSLLKLLLKFDI